ncbi:MAG: ImmA/IrrE family metallo-endopeptidase ['Candidatus Kapabacteria' thiocyanatum]|uniref:IrrE N-terminal-like domain-containing protein n=1 Tax=Candidatus Kapaibacterium thiocyanatum TaxID=1895771 RepID=A0A1M3L5V6_9BACT|nr:ImmA/IrrE family metallo-endopeptidase ['Candidatus Kapabacteria' thiocyanatum]OJX60948.1 MAG: hypothetical protein BGO89_05130 ['Candidatus Kapabacteria' thiocyanatum]
MNRDAFRGLSVPGGQYPAIAVNNKEYSTEFKLYTLLHELVHVLQHDATTISASTSMDTANEAAVERIAGDVLLPATDLNKLLRVTTPGKLMDDTDHLRSISGTWDLPQRD